MWLYAVFGVLVVLVLRSLNSPGSKGRAGEARLRRILESIHDENRNRFLHDITLPYQNGTTQIDHVLVSPYGVFVIETKNYSGWIYGSANNKTWTHVFHRRKFRFQNPLHQNHVKAVQSVTGLGRNHVHSLVVFVGTGELKTRMPEEVTDISGLQRYFEGKSEVVLSEEEISTIADRIENQRYPSGVFTNHRHRRHLRDLAAEKSSAHRFPEPYPTERTGSSGRIRLYLTLLIVSVAAYAAWEYNPVLHTDLGAGLSDDQPRDSFAAEATIANPPSSQSPKLKKPLGRFDLLSGEVVDIPQGDLITIELSGREYKIRLAEIHAPDQAHDWYDHARSALAEKVSGKVVTVEVMDTDASGRITGRIWYKGRDISLEMLQEGHAWANGNDVTENTFLDRESAARSAGIGLWSLNNPEM